MSDRKQLFLPLDCESGGFPKGVALLSTHLAVCDESWEIVDELELMTKPNDGHYLVSAEALEVNKINLVEHDKIAITYSAAGQELRNFLWKYSENGKIKLIPMGKNVAGDITWITDNLLGMKAWSQFVSYRLYDLTPLIIYLKRKGKIAEDAPESLSGLATHFGIEADWHTARGDNYAGIKVMKKLESL
jgi:hypothetical protein